MSPFRCNPRMQALALAAALLTGGCMGPMVMPRGGQALLVLDLQRDFLQPDGRFPVAMHQVPALLDATHGLVQQAHDADALIIRIDNAFMPWDLPGNLSRNGAAIRGTPGAAVDPRVDVQPDLVLEKHQSDAFSNPDLDATLRGHGVWRLVVVGVFADQCVLATVQSAVNRGYHVTVVEEAVATSSDPARERALRLMAWRGVEVVPDGVAPLF